MMIAPYSGRKMKKKKEMGQCTYHAWLLLRRSPMHSTPPYGKLIATCLVVSVASSKMESIFFSFFSIIRIYIYIYVCVFCAERGGIYCR